jgi:hypothetical protein
MLRAVRLEAASIPALPVFTASLAARIAYKVQDSGK